jgi:two-component system nitrate/nitrite response regulator NarL
MNAGEMDWRERIARVALVDLDAAWRRRLSAFFTGRPGYYWLGGYATESELMRGLASQNPDVILAGFGGAGDAAPELLRGLKLTWPQVPVCVLAASVERPSLAVALLTGARGYVLKRCVRRDLSAAVQGILRAALFISLEATPQVFQVFHQQCAVGLSLGRLTALERSVLALSLERRTDKEISSRLGRSERTISGHVYRILAKLGLRSRYELQERLLAWKLEAEPAPSHPVAHPHQT